MRSWIQDYILLELTRHKTRRYKELRPPDVEGNLFMYHLKGLIKEGLVEKSEVGYELTNSGLQLAARISLKTGKVRLQPKLLTAVVAKNEAGKQLFIRWLRQPNSSQVSLPYGLVHFGENISAMAALELAEKAGLVGDMHFLGDIYVRGMRGDETNRHMLLHVFEATNIRPGRESELRPDVCEWFWAHANDIPKEAFVSGFYEVNQLIQKGFSGLHELTVIE
jgi:ADP-ribose pyrophosphatase YjhB (NUDIX family)